MKTQKAGVEIWDLDGGTGLRCAVAVNGIVRYVGSAAQCKVRAEILMPLLPDRERQDKMLVRSI